MEKTEMTMIKNGNLALGIGSQAVVISAQIKIRIYLELQSDQRKPTIRLKLDPALSLLSGV